MADGSMQLFHLDLEVAFNYSFVDLITLQTAAGIRIFAKPCADAFGQEDLPAGGEASQQHVMCLGPP